VTIPVIVRVDVSDQSSLEQALVENLQRADLNAVEEADAYQRLIDEFGLTHDETAVRVGKSRAAVTNTLRLLQLPAGVKEAIKDGSISAGHGRALLSTPDRGLQEDICAVVVERGLSVRATEELVKNGGVEPEEQPEVGEGALPAPDPTGKAKPVEPRRTTLKPLPAAGVVELEELLSTYLNTRVNVEMLTSKKGKVHVEFADIEDLERLYRLMLGNRSGS
jgi:ParB family chromosome partitioning protein